MIKPRKIKLKPLAEKDLTDIYHYSVREYGSVKAKSYIFNIDKCFKKLPQQPEVGLLRNELGEDILSFPVISHVVFYRFDSTELIVIRVLHKSRDFIAHL